MLIPTQPAPQLSVATLGGGEFDLARDHGDWGSLIVFFRGRHCPICMKELTALEAAVDDFEALGVKVLALSMDTSGRSAESAREAGLSRLTLGHGLTAGSARRWGLYLTEAISDKEPKVFSEPGHFLVRADGTLHHVSVQSAPFGRPAPADLLRSVQMNQQKGYPARGSFTGASE